MAVPGGCGWEGWVSLCLCMWVAWLLFLLVRPPRPGQPQGGVPLVHLSILVPVGCV